MAVPAAASATSVQLSVSHDGDRILFYSNDSLLPEDGDSGAYDIYASTNGVTELMTPGTSIDVSVTNPADPVVTPDGRAIAFASGEQLATSDIDSSVDVYLAALPMTAAVDMTHISTGSTGGNGAFDAVEGGIDDEGLKVFFSTEESLESADGEANYTDVYVRNLSNSTTSLASTNDTSTANDMRGAQFLDNSNDGQYVFWRTDEDIENDGDGNRFDIYARNVSGPIETTLVSTNDAANANGDFDADWGGMLPGGAVAYVDTQEPYENDTDGASWDVYGRDVNGGTTDRISNNDAGNAQAMRDAFFSGASDNGDTVFFETNEAIEAADTDTGCPAAEPCTDIYARHPIAGTTDWVSTNSTENANAMGLHAEFNGATSGGSLAFVSTTEALSTSDFDAVHTDIFERHLAGPFIGDTFQISIDDFDSGGGPHDANFTGASDDGTRVFFRTDESLEPTDDTDGVSDVYQRDDTNNTEILSLGLNGLGNNSIPVSSDVLNSGDGSAVVFNTAEQLVPEDQDGGDFDVYANCCGVLRLISTGNPPPAPPATTAQAPVQALEPVHGVSITVEPVGGIVLVKVPGGTFVPISEIKVLPMGSIIDAKNGFAKIKSARGDGTIDEGTFWEGLFQVSQAGAVGAPLDAKLVDKLRCKGGKKKPKTASRSAVARSSKAASSRSLWGKTTGSYSTRGARGSATVRGTQWLTIDRCKAKGQETTFKVIEGVLAIDDFDAKGAVNKLLRAPGKLKLQ